MVAPLLLELLGHPLNLHGAPKVITYLQGIITAIPGDQKTAFIAAVLIGAIGLKNLLLFLTNAVYFQLTRLATEDLRRRTLEVLTQAELSYFATVKQGEFVHLAWRDVEDASRVLVAVSQLFSLVLMLSVFLLFMLWLSVPLTIVAILIYVLIVPISLSMLQRAHHIAKEARVHAASFTSGLIQVFVGIRLVKIAAAEAREQHRLLTLSAECADDSYKSGLVTTAVGPTTEFTGTIALVAVVLIGRMLIPADEGQGFSAVLVTFLFLLFRLLTHIGVLNGRRADLARNLPSAEALAEFLQAEDKRPIQNGTINYKHLEKEIRFESIAFAYDRGAEPILRGIDFSIPKGTSLAIVGESGAGKTTIADLLCRFCDVTEGAILLDDHDIREFDVRSLRRSIGLVSQDTFLFNNTIGYNIRYGRPDATESEVIQAATQAHALSFIQELPLGFDSPVGERGALLSAGECQRIAIARALISDPDILILDEATSSLDPLSEHSVQEALEELMHDRTTLIIAHRLATVKKAGKIAVLGGGQIVEMGSHEELIERNGLYRKMCEIGSAIV